MKKIRNTFMISLLAFAAASCSEETGSNTLLTGDAELQILPQVTGMVQTKAAVTGATFASGAQVGLRLRSSNLTVNSMYDNFYAYYNNGTNWSYILNGTNIGTVLSGFSNWGMVTVMGYYPYNDNVADFNAIPFRIAENDGTTTNTAATTDYMVAGTKTKQMAQAPKENAVSLEFEHLMTYVYLYLTRQYQGTTLTLQKVTLELDNDRNFVVAGTYCADNPDMNDLPALITSLNRTNKLEITTNHTITAGTGDITIPLVIMPQLAVSDGDANVTVTLYFKDADGNDFLFDDHANPKMTFALSNVDSGEGFLRGKQYRLRATLGTFVHFDGVPLVEDRPIDNANDEHIEI